MKRRSSYIVVDLGVRWMELVEKGEIRFRTTDIHSDPILVCLVNLGGGIIGFTANNLRTHETVSAEVLERPIDGSRFRIQFNGYRALKPNTRPLAPGRQADQPSDFAQCPFHCMDPHDPISLHQKDPITVLQRNGVWVPYPNLVPFETRGHVVWVRVKQNGSTMVIPHLPQVLNLADTEDWLGLLSASRHMAIFFNGAHAGASVPHLHFQSIYMQGTFAIEHARFEQAHGHWWTTDYPAAGVVYPARVKPARLFEDIARLQDAEIPYNLIGIGPHVYLIGRHIEHEVVEEFPGGIIASMELAGKVITANRDLYDIATYRQIVRAIRKTTLSQREMLHVLGRRQTALRLVAS